MTSKAKTKIYNARYYSRNPDKFREKNKRWHDKNPTKSIFNRRRSAARKAGIPFTIEFNDIVWPAYCPVLHIKLDYSRKRKPSPFSPSIDKLVPALGYVPGNVAVISFRANEVKGNATIGEIIALAYWMQRTGS